jgi:3-oxoacyl-[acyl-carrier-protein] synthase II
VTGLGAISPLGQDIRTNWSNLLTGKSGVGPITRFDASMYQTQIAAEINDFDPGDHMDPKEAKRLDRYIQFSMVAVQEAVANAGLEIGEHNADDIGVLIGSAIGGLSTMDKGFQAYYDGGPRRVNPFTGPMMISNMASGIVAIDLGVRGPNFCIVSACATGSHALGEAYEIIKRGDARAMITGGSEAPVIPFALAAFDRLQVLSRRNDEPQKASRPFDAKRDGFAFAEGAAALVFENLEDATSRGAPILAEVVGYAGTNDAFHISAPAEDGGGMALAMQRALKKAGLGPEDVDYINAHGTSTRLNDKSETAAIKGVFGERAYQIPISATKSMTGHLLGGAGAIEGAVCVMAIRDQMIHPTINQEYPDSDCDLDYVPNDARKASVKVAISNSAGFGGHNATLVFKSLEA